MKSNLRRFVESGPIDPKTWISTVQTYPGMGLLGQLGNFDFERRYGSLKLGAYPKSSDFDRFSHHFTIVIYKGKSKFLTLRRPIFTQNGNFSIRSKVPSPDRSGL